MHYLIEQAFLNIEGIGSRITKGEYDLINSDGAVIIPHLWETFVEPDMLVTMQMWPPPSPQTPPALSTTQFSSPVPSTPPQSPLRSSMPQPIPITRRLRSTSQMSRKQASNRKARSKPVKLSPPKAKPKESRRPSPQISYRSYAPSGHCTCWECHYSQIRSQNRPSAPSSLASQYKVTYPRVTSNVGEPERLTKATTKYTESISKVEPILELEGEQIYELE